MHDDSTSDARRRLLLVYRGGVRGTRGCGVRHLRLRGDPTYKQVCSGETGHAEVVLIEYDTDVLGFEDVLKVFFTVHDPTQLNRQGPDVGTQYRSIILAHDDEQREFAAAFVDELDSEYDDDVVTEVVDLETFYEAEEAHQNYYDKNPNDRYCTFHADPKIEKVREKFATRAQ